MTTGNDLRSNDIARAEWTLATSRNYTEADIQRLLNAFEREGIEGVEHYVLLRESADWLPPAVDIALSIAGSIGVGVLGAIGADVWAKLKKAIGIAQQIEIEGQPPQVTVTLEYEDQHLRLVVVGNDSEQVSQVLDRALPKMDSLSHSHTLWYEPQVGGWLTLDEKIAWQDDQDRRDVDPVDPLA